MSNSAAVRLESGAADHLIVILRSHRVMLSPILARLYGVTPKVLVQAVKRNALRFPPDFMFRLTWEEAARCRTRPAPDSRSQFVTLKKQGANTKYLPYAFTEQGVAMLSSVLRSPRAIRVNIEIMRAFVRLRRLLASHEDLARKLDALEGRYDAQFRIVFDAIRELMEPPEPRRRRIGFRARMSRPGGAV